MSRWWRAYDEAVDDPKLILLSDKTHRAWFNLMCIASANGGVLPEIRVVAVKLRVSTQRAAAVITELVSAGLLDKRDDGAFEPHNWASRQFISDSSAERVKRHREKRAAAGLQSQWTAPKALRQAVYERDGFACVYCGSADRLSLDHRTPEIRGGTHDIDNLATACLACNGAKRDMTETEFRESVTLLKRPQRTEAENREQKGSEAVASGAEAPPDPTEPERELFRRGKQVLGKSSGGQITKLLRVAGNVALARSKIELAATKDNPQEFIAKVIAHAGAGPPARPLTQHQIERDKTRSILDALDSVSSNVGGQANLEFLRHDPGGGSGSVRSGIRGDVIDVPACRGRESN